MDKLKKQFIKEVWGAEDENIILPYVFTDWEWTDNDMYGGPEGKCWYRIRCFGIKEERKGWENKYYNGDIYIVYITEIIKNGKKKREHWQGGKTSYEEYLESLNTFKKECEKKGLTVYRV